MKTAFFMLSTFSLLAETAMAGFRDPVPDASGRGQELGVRYSTSAAITPATAAASKKSTASEGGYGPAFGPTPPPSAATAGSPGSRTPASILNSAYISSAHPRNPAGPVPKAPSLPSGPGQIQVPGVRALPSQPTSVFRDTVQPIQFNSRSKDQIHAFSRQARAMPMPTKEYGAPQAGEIVRRYASALSPKPHRTIRTPIRLSLNRVQPIRRAPSPIHYENMVKRLDALFEGLYGHYPLGIAALWELSGAKSNDQTLQARDALFAGILSERAGWPTVAANLLERGAGKKLESDERYLRILWKELDAIHNQYHVDRVTAKVNPLRVKSLDLDGDHANFSLARRAQKGRSISSVTVEVFAERVQDSLLKDRLRLYGAIAQVRNKGAQEEQGLSALRQLESEGHAEVREEARLALARSLLRKGESAEALTLYQNILKTPANRLEVLAEQSYAELRAGEYQGSLGKAMGLQSPYFQYGFAPDIHLIEVLSRKALCDFGGAEVGLKRFAERYVPEAKALQALVDAKADPKQFYETLISYHGETEPLRYRRYLLHLSTVAENQGTMNAALKELERVEKVGLKKYESDRPAKWDAFTADMRNTWSLRAGSLREESARAALAEAEYALERLRANFAQMELIGLDVATGASKSFNRQSAMNFPVSKVAALQERDRFHWPFEDEVWEDELDFLRMKNPSKCGEAALPRASVAGS